MANIAIKRMVMGVRVIGMLFGPKITEVRMLALKSKFLPLGVALCTMASVAQADPVTIATGDDWPPFADTHMDGGGYATEIVTAVLEKMGADYSIDVLPWTRGYEMAVAGKYTGTFLWYDTPERRAEINYSDPLIVLDVAVVMKAGAADGLNSLSDLNGQSVCIPKGYAVHGPVQEMVDAGTLTLQQPPDLIACVKQVQAGRVDAVVDASAVILYLAEQNGIAASELAVLPEPVSESPLYLLVSRNAPNGDAFLSEFNAALHELEADGTVASILP
ncbi:MAG: transporter substrate-binding domain-containing protein [Maritimibacter sp.]